MKDRKLNTYIVTEKVGYKYETTTIHAPSDGIALEFCSTEARGQLVKIERVKSEFFVLDYVEIENEGNMEIEVKYRGDL